MIFDQLNNMRRYESLHPQFDMVFDFIAENDLNTLPQGRYPIHDDEVFVIIDEYQTQPATGSAYEGHRNYIDIQVILSGSELMGVAPLTHQIPTQAYDHQKDFALYKNPQPQEFFLKVSPGTFVIFYPEDLHMPCISEGAQAKSVKKAVFKIAIC